MRKVLLRSAVLFIMAAMLGGHVTELFDRWDHTLRTGKDADYTVVLVAACAGAAFIAGRSSRLLHRLVSIVAEAAPCIFRSAVIRAVALKTFAFDLSPPSTIAPIRI